MQTDLTLRQILERKGYDLSEINDIVSIGDNCLDYQTRAAFGLLDHSIFLEGEYHIGDADEEQVEIIAKARGYADKDELFAAMDNFLINLADKVPEK